MKAVQEVLYDLVSPMVENHDSLRVEALESLNENEIICVIYAKNDDIARLIGRQGVMAQAIRSTMALASRVHDKHISIKFESY